MSHHYYDPKTGKTKTIDQIRADHPSASVPENADLSVLGYYPVSETEEPSYDRITQGLRFFIEEMQTKTGIVYARNWHVYDLPQDMAERNRARQQEELKNNVVSFAQKRLDDFAKTRDYDDIKSACTYYGSPVQRYHLDATRALELRSQTWEALYSLLGDIESGVVGAPESISEVEPYLPTLTWE